MIVAGQNPQNRVGWGPSVLCGTALAVAVQISATSGAVQPWWWVVAVGAIVVVLDGEKSATSLLVFIGVVVGLLPIAGYLYLPPWLSSLGFILGAYVSVKLASTSIRLGGLGEGVLSVAPAVFGSIFTYWWWRDLFRGSQEDILTRLMPQWDLSTHFLFFSSIVRDGRYLALSSPESPEFEWVGREYPAGIHYVWAQFAMPLRSVSEIDKASLISFFAHAIVLTGAVAVGVVSLGLARLGHTPTARFVAGIVGAAAGTALICIGPLSTTFWGGFANVSAVAIGISMLISFLLRPHDDIQKYSWILALGVWTLTYNWYPTVALFFPALISVFLSLVLSDARRNALVCILACIIGVTPPVFFTFSLGLSHLHGLGGVPEFPQPFLFGGSAISLGLALMFIGRLKPSVVLLLVTPAITLFSLGWYLISSVGELRYYFFKFGSFLGAYLMLLTLGIGVHQILESLDTKSIRVVAQLRYGLGAFALAIGALWTFGYWGPQLNGLGSEAAGLIPRIEIRESRSKLSDFRPLAKTVMSEAATNRTRDLSTRSCVLLILPRSNATDATPEEVLTFGRTDPQNAIPLANVWFRALSDAAVAETWPYNYELIFGDELSTTAIVTELVDSARDNNRNKDICVLSTRSVIESLERTPYVWRTYEIGA